MKFRVWHVRTLLQSQEFWLEYCFYMCYVALLWFMVQVMILDGTIHDYIAVLWLQVCSLFGSAIVFVWLKTHYQPSSRWTKLLYFVIANGPRLWVAYYIIRGMSLINLLSYTGMMLVVTVIEWYTYDRIFDRCCDYGYRLKTLYRTRRKGHHENH